MSVILSKGANPECTEMYTLKCTLMTSFGSPGKLGKAKTKAKMKKEDSLPPGSQYEL